jgi:hypothetical protein
MVNYNEPMLLVKTELCSIARRWTAYTESAAKTGWRESGDSQRVRAQFNDLARTPR